MIDPAVDVALLLLRHRALVPGPRRLVLPGAATGNSPPGAGSCPGSRDRPGRGRRPAPSPPPRARTRAAPPRTGRAATGSSPPGAGCCPGSRDRPGRGRRPAPSPRPRARTTAAPPRTGRSRKSARPSVSPSAIEIPDASTSQRLKLGWIRQQTRRERRAVRVSWRSLAIDDHSPRLHVNDLAQRLGHHVGSTPRRGETRQTADAS